MPKHNINRNCIPDLVFEIYCEMWESGDTNCHGVPAIYMSFFSRYIISVFYNFFKHVPDRYALNRASLELLRQELSTAEQFRQTAST